MTFFMIGSSVEIEWAIVLIYSIIFGKWEEGIRGQGFRIARGECCPLIACENSTRQLGVRSGGAAHFVILSGEKRRMLKNSLSENMRTESKDLSAAKYKY